MAPSGAKRATSAGWASSTWVSRWRRSRGPPLASAAALDGVEALAHTAVADGVDVGVEARAFELTHVAGEARLVEVVEPQRPRQGRAEIGLEQRRRGVLDEPVGVELHLREAQPRSGLVRVERAQGRDLPVVVLVGVGPQRDDGARGELSLLLGALPGLDVAALPVAPRIDDGSDAVAAQHAEAGAQGVVVHALEHRIRRQGQVHHQLPRRVEQDARGCSRRRIAQDHAAHRVRRAGIDARRRESGAVHPHRVGALLHHRRRSIRNRVVEDLHRRPLCGEHVVDEVAVAQHPIGAHLISLAGAQPGDVALRVEGPA